MISIRIFEFLQLVLVRGKKIEPRGNMLDIIKGINIPNNPQAMVQLVMVIILFVVLTIVAIFFLKLPQLKKKKRDYDLYKFLLDFKGLSDNEKKIVEKLIKQNGVKTKYKFIILEPIFNKYVDMEIIKIEQSLIPSKEKEKSIGEYHRLKGKLFSK